MKLFVISDTHGSTGKALDVYSSLGPIDLIVHLGDVERDARRIAELTGKDVVSVRGNNEASHAKEDFRILETEFGNLLLTHGHKQKVKLGLQSLLYKAEELGCKAALFGHTHVPVYIEANGVFLLNPGSLTFPSGGSQGSYALVETAPSSFSASIVYCARS